MTRSTALAAIFSIALGLGTAQANDQADPLQTGSVSKFAALDDKIANFLTTGQTGAKPCINPRSGDRDIFRNAKALSKHCIRLHKIREAGKTWNIYEIGGKRRGPLWAVLHDNENAAFDAAVTGLNRYGGRIVAIEAGERRNFPRARIRTATSASNAAATSAAPASSTRPS